MKHVIFLSNAQYSDVLLTDDIVVCIANGSYTKVLMNNNKSILVSKNLSWVENLISLDSFIRLHKSYYVNLKYVNKVFNGEDKIRLFTEIEIPISRYKKKIFWEKITTYYQNC